MSKESRALARREDIAELVRGTIQRVQQKAADTLEGLYEPEYIDGQPNPKYNPDAVNTWADCSMKTRAALVIVKSAEGKNEVEFGRQFGVIILDARAPDAQTWEADARRVDDAERKKAAIDVESTDAP
jgi:hypothetical protein